MNQRDGGYDHGVTDAADLPTGHVVIEEKPFYHGNLRLQLLHDTVMDVYYINVHDRVDRSNHDLWGVWCEETLAIARAKFASIRL